MKPDILLELLAVAEKLKCNTRHSWTSSGRRESVAEHSWRLALMALLVQDEFPSLDIGKVIRMCLIHDLGEAFTGDIPAFKKQSADTVKEDALFRQWLSSFPPPYCEELSCLFQEMVDQETQEAQLYKALDRLEAVIQHNEADLSTWLPLEYQLQLTYGADEVAFSPYLCRLKEAINHVTRQKIANQSVPEQL